MADTIESLRLRLEVYEKDMDDLHKRIADLTKELDVSRKAVERFRKLANNSKGELTTSRAEFANMYVSHREAVAELRRRCAQRILEARAQADEWRLAVHEVGIAAS